MSSLGPRFVLRVMKAALTQKPECLMCIWKSDVEAIEKALDEMDRLTIQVSILTNERDEARALGRLA